MSELLGKDHLTVRYDPIFIDEYKNTRKNQHLFNYRQIHPEEYEKLARSIALSASSHHIEVFTCNEGNILEPYGIPGGACFSQKKAFSMISKILKKWNARDCGCVEIADIGTYNSCMHMRRYCYANYDEKQILENFKNHDPDSDMKAPQSRLG